MERSRLESALSNLGYEVVGVEDGDSVLERLAAEHFDLLLLDLVLPGLDGMGVLGALRARGATLPVVVAVTPAGLDGAVSALGAGARDFVVKPAGTLRLRVAITNALALAAAQTASAAPSPRAATAVPHLRLAHDADRAIAVEWPQIQSQQEPAASQLALLDGLGQVRPMEQLEADAIRAAVSLYGGRMTEVARRLGIGRSTLYRKLNALGLPVPEPMQAMAVAAE
ncbi:hypothetical protein GCM10007301_54810 [Azorhizobium oxalatiphilum]|uniref:Response regulatory domain-containing protein n=1 Tax=Azorhizobium oxalatiphilum TaxID=980631 RepID=A0A917CHS7_9HYPH|nr:hypothetical protein GCM10007301_54810 [Azorhizobium oxalatiphilum]